MEKKVITYFSKDWLKDPDFEDWIASSSNNTEVESASSSNNVESAAKILSSPIWGGKLWCVMQMVKSINHMLIESRCFSNQSRPLILQ